ncbi:hypothetical protein GCM10010969_05170 [Saccharibacillus kuerlensis]|uniref:Uncharacterized protein n=1 Tax=Saccharibacillus kuerlensis TaxID=459527 RepID=A0ABQ2KWE4_9BACL|nr:hypothetical protein GCM10010969_05170 [Saccharibacillus kuerlensis]
MSRAEAFRQDQHSVFGHVFVTFFGKARSCACGTKELADFSIRPLHEQPHLIRYSGLAAPRIKMRKEGANQTLDTVGGPGCFRLRTLLR